MTVSSRTPEGTPSECALCGAKIEIDFSSVGGDAPCPVCGHLLWESAALVQRISSKIELTLGTKPGVIDGLTEIAELGGDSLDTVELVMELEEEFDVNISDDDAESILTIKDLVQRILKGRGLS